MERNVNVTADEVVPPASCLSLFCCTGAVSQTWSPDISGGVEADSRFKILHSVFHVRDERNWA